MEVLEGQLIVSSGRSAHMTWGCRGSILSLMVWVVAHNVILIVILIPLSVTLLVSAMGWLRRVRSSELLLAEIDDGSGVISCAGCGRYRLMLASGRGGKKTEKKRGRKREGQWAVMEIPSETQRNPKPRGLKCLFVDSASPFLVVRGNVIGETLTARFVMT